MTARTWLKRSRWALVALAVLVPAAVVTSLSVDWFAYVNATNDDPRPVARGDVGVDVAEGVEYSLVDVERIDADSDEGRELGALAGTSVLIVTVHVDGTHRSDDSRTCALVLTAPGPGEDRIWDDRQSDVYITAPDSAQNYCSFPDVDDPDDENPEVFDYQAVFVVPESAADEVKLRVTTGAFGLRQVLQLDW